MAQTSQQTATRLYTVLREHLAGDPEGERLIAAFAADRVGSRAALAARLSAELPGDPALQQRLLAALGEDPDARFVTMVTGGHVGQIVNVARLGVLNLTVKRYLYVFKDVRQLVVFLAATALVGLAVAFGVWRAQQPARLTGDFNIAVAQIGAVDDAGVLRVTGDSAKISQALANYLDSEYSATDFGLAVQVGHDRMPFVDEDRQAARLARAVNADLVIYGSIVGDETSASLLPRFWVDPNPDVAEISGQGALEAPIRYEPAKLPDAGYLTETLRANAAVLTLFTKALVSLRADKLDAAALALDQALAEARGDFHGKEVLYLLGSTIARLQARYDLALERALASLALNPEYARAFVAAGNVYYDRVAQQGDWTREDLLDEAARWYTGALEATIAAPGAYIDEKVHASLGNVALVKGQLHDDPALLQQAAGHYEQVIQAYEASRDRAYRADLREVAAAAYFGLGVVHQAQAGQSQAERYYRRCASVTAVARTQERCEALAEGRQRPAQEPIAPPPGPATAATATPTPTVMPTPTPAVATVRVPDLAVFRRPAAGSTRFAVLYEGDLYPVLGRTPTARWLQIHYSGQWGWIDADGVAIAGDLWDVPVTGQDPTSPPP